MSEGNRAEGASDRLQWPAHLSDLIDRIDAWGDEVHGTSGNVLREMEAKDLLYELVEHLRCHRMVVVELQGLVDSYSSEIAGVRSERDQFASVADEASVHIERYEQELVALRSAADEYVRAVREHDDRVSFGSYRSPAEHNAGADRAERAESRLRALASGEVTR